MHGKVDTPFDRNQFPLLNRLVGNDGSRQLVYLDSAATTLVPNSVIDSVANFLKTSCSNIHRGAHLLAEEATDAFESSREEVASLLGIHNPDHLLFTHGTTESMNIIVGAWAEYILSPGDIVAVAEDNHHANIVCWQMLAERRGIEVVWIPISPQGFLDYEAWLSIVERKPKLVALTHQSNVISYRQPNLAAIINDAHCAGAVVVLDGAQVVGHEPVNLEELKVDFYAASAHKMLGMTGIGALACSSRVLENMRPFMGGGGMIERVSKTGYRVVSGPAGFEAGTPAIESAVAWTASIKMLQEAELQKVGHHVTRLATLAQQALTKLPGVRVLGDTSLPAMSLVTFTVEGLHPHDVSCLLDKEGIAVRAGHHCAQPLYNALGFQAGIRASFYGYSTEEEVDKLVGAVGCIADRCASEKGEPDGA